MEDKSKKQLIQTISELKDLIKKLEKKEDQRKKTKEALRESEEQYRAIFESLHDVYYRTDREGLVTTISPSVRVQAGYDPKDVIGHQVTDFYVNPSDREIFKSRIKEFGFINDYELQLKAKDGRVIEVSASSNVIIGKEGKPIGVEGILRDITQRKKVTEALLESEEKHRNIFEAANDAIFLFYEGRFLDCNSKTLSMYGCEKKSDIIGRSPFDFSPTKQPDGRDSKKKGLEYIKAAISGKPQSFYWKHIRKNGTSFDAEVSLNLIVLGGLKHLQAIVRDVTERKLVEEELKSSEERLKHLFEYAPDAYYLSDLKGNFIDGNRAAEDLLGHKKNDIIGKNFLNLKILSAQDTSKAVKLLAKNILGKGTGPDEFALHRKDSTKVIAEIRTYPIKIKDKTLVLGIARDISERKQAELALQESEEKFRNISDSAQDAILMVDSQGKISYWNKAAEKIFGYTFQEALGKKMHTLIAPQRFHKAHKDSFLKFKQIGQGAVFGKVLELKALKKGGEEFPIELAVSMTKIKGEKNIIGIVRDITERKRAEEELQKLASVVHYSSELVNLASLDGKMIFLNEAGGKIFGIDPKAVDKHIIMEVIPEHLADLVTNELLPALIKHGKWEGDLQYRNIKTGGLTDVHAMCFTVKDPETGTPKYLANVSLDITERKKERGKLEESYQKLQKAIAGNIQLMATTVEIRDPYTAGHQRRVADLARAIAVEMELPKDQIEGIYMAGVIHDVGKISVPSEILSKPGELTEMEFSLIQTHPQVGYDILKEIEFPWPISQIVYQHHERMDGNGYPQGLKGKNILLEARIMCVADVVEAMASHRPYRPSLGIDIALQEIEKHSGTLYDESVVNACTKVFKEKHFKFSD